jgi:murein endopeptidase
MGVGDMSDSGGGPMSGHACHQNGLEVDIRYVRNDGLEAPLNLATQISAYSRALTVELLQRYMDTGMVDVIYVDPAANITPTDVPGVQVDPSGTHADHFHVRLKDPDGPNSNNC